MNNPDRDSSTLHISETSEAIELQADEEEALKYAKRIKDFLEGILVYVILLAGFSFAGMFSDPVVFWVFGGIGIGLAAQGLLAFEIVRLPWQNLQKS